MENTPSRAVERFLKAWKDRNWEDMAAFAQLSWKQERSDPALTISTLYNWITLEDFSVGGSRSVTGDDLSAAHLMADVSVYMRVTFGYDKENLFPAVGYYIVRVVCEAAPYQPSAKGTWGVNPSSVRRAEEGPAT